MIKLQLKVLGMPTTHAERRRHARHAVRASAWLEFRGDEHPRGTICVDLSTEGAQFSAVGPATPGDGVLVRLHMLPGALCLECKGRVRWAKRMPNGLHHFGVRLMDLSDREREQLGAYLGARKANSMLAAC